MQQLPEEMAVADFGNCEIAILILNLVSAAHLRQNSNQLVSPVLATTELEDMSMACLDSPASPGETEHERNDRTQLVEEMNVDRPASDGSRLPLSNSP